MELDYKLGRRVNNPDNYNWQEINLEDYRITKPVVLVLGGNATNNTKASNSYTKTISSLLGVFNKDVDLLVMCYHDGNVTTNFEEINVAKVVNNLFLPLVSTKDGERLTVEQACKNMRKVTVFAHCFGVEIVNEITERLMDEMRYMNYTHDEQTKIMEQLFMVGFASWANNSHIKSVNMISPHDTVFVDIGLTKWENLSENYNKIEMSNKDKKYFEDCLNKSRLIKRTLLRDFYTKESKCFVSSKPDNDNSIDLMCTKLYERESDHKLKGVARDENWLISDGTTKTGDYVSKCFSAALCNSVANSIINGMHKKLVPLDMKNIKRQLEEVVRPLNQGKNEITNDTITKD